MAQDYAGRNVVFIEYDVDNAPNGRVNRWWAAFGGGTVGLPMVMTDSGNQISNGVVSYYNVYKAMVDNAMARAAQAEIQAYWWRSGNKAEFYVQVKNLSGVTLSTTNLARVHAIVYEDAKVNVTNRFGRLVVDTSITSLAPNAAATYRLETPELSGVDWAKLHYVVVVDYRPGISAGAYDMLQAVMASPLPAFTIQPETTSFVVDPSDTFTPTIQLNLQGASFLNWTATPGANWLNLSPLNGPMTTQPALSVVRANLAAGWQQGTITLTTTDGLFTDQITVNAYLGALEKLFLPTVLR